MQYIVLIYTKEADWGSLTQEQLQAAYGEYTKYNEKLGAAGVLRGGNELKPSTTATTLRLQDGKVLTTDGPFAETKEQLGGYYILDCENLEQAIHWAGQCPGIHHGTIELRPLGMGAPM